MLSNKEVSGIFKSLSDLMELHNENAFKAKSYANAAFQIGRLQGSVMQMQLQELENTPGIGKSVAAKIIELQETGSLQALENLYQITPTGILEIMRIKGLGGKKVAVIWRELQVETVGELLYACYENRLSKLKGFGEKTQQSVISSIEYYQSNIGKYHYASLEKEAAVLLDALRKLPGCTGVEICGAMRRKCNVIEKMEFLFAGSIDFTKISDILTLTEQRNHTYIAKTMHETPVELHICNSDAFYVSLFLKTGAEKHVSEVISKIDHSNTYPSEEAIYLAAGMQYVPPELREDTADISNIELTALLEDEDIKGVVHNHSTWSDGKNTIEEMAMACKENGYSYFVISDHSKTAVYAGGLTNSQVIEQHKEIDALNKKMTGFKVFKSIESDILYDGSLDYDEEILKQFDLVIASVHSNLKMDEEKATARLLRAIENPYTTILGHLTGRLLLSRPGYPVHHKKIIEACAANDVVIEMNANPYRLDIDYAYIPLALQHGVYISVNPDAHSVDGIGDIHYGVLSARKGGLTKKRTWNAMTLPEVEQWLMERKKKKGIS
jgi:DNA polymerase (family 10)